VAAPVTDPAVLRIDFGERFLSELRSAVDSRPEAARFLIGTGSLPPGASESTAPLLVVGRAIGDTCKEVADGLVRRTLPRENLVYLTGPWLVSRVVLTQALERLGPGQAEDPLELFRGSGLPIRLAIAT
jgi:hypothetical protein